MPGNLDIPAGSSKTGEPAFLAVGKIRRPHGVHGEVLITPHSKFLDIFKPGKSVFIGEQHREILIQSQRVSKDGLLLELDGYHSPEEVGRLRNQVIYVLNGESQKLEADEYYLHQILDMNVLDEFGTSLGTVSGVIETGANDVYVVITPSGQEILLPAIKEVIRNIDLMEHRMIVHILPGLISFVNEESRRINKNG